MLFSHKVHRTPTQRTVLGIMGSVEAMVTTCEIGCPNSVEFFSFAKRAFPKDPNLTTPSDQGAIQTLSSTWLALLLALKSKGLPSARNMERPVHRIVIMVDAPWYVAVSRDVRHESVKDELLSPALFEELIKKETEETVKEYQKKVGLPLTVIERAATVMYANGYPRFDAPWNISARSFRIPLYLSMMSHDLKNALVEASEKVFPHAEVSFQSAGLVALSTARDTLPIDHFLILVASGSMTEIMLVRDGAPVAIKPMQYGSEVWKQNMARTLSISLPVLEERARLVRDNTAGEKIANDFQKAKEAEFLVWQKEFEKTLAEFGGALPFPRTVRIAASSEFAPFLEEAISTSDTQYLTMSRRAMDASLLTPEEGENMNANNTQATDVLRPEEVALFPRLQASFVKKTLCGLQKAHGMLTVR